MKNVLRRGTTVFLFLLVSIPLRARFASDEVFLPAVGRVTGSGRRGVLYDGLGNEPGGPLPSNSSSSSSNRGRRTSPGRRSRIRSLRDRRRSTRT